MVSIKTKYIILIWIIILILFVFYCIIRLKYLKEKYDNTTINNFPNSPNSPNAKFPIINYINNIEKQNKITNVSNPPQCKTLYDDNLKVQTLGYSNCESAYSDYITKGFDVNNKFGQKQSLSDICPIATKSLLYTQCMTALLNKFTSSANMVDNITTDMTTSINQRLQNRSSILNNIQNQLNPLIFNKDQNDFNNYMKSNNSLAKYKDDTIGLVNNYYQDRYKGGLGIIQKEGFVASTSVYVMDPAIEKLFFGNYIPITGQFLALGDLTLSLGYDDLLDTNPIPTQTETLSQTETPSQTENSSPSQTETPSQTQSQSSKLNQIKNIILTISSISNNLNVIYNIVTINNYKTIPNAIKLIISSQNISKTNYNPGNSQTIMQLLFTLGITSPTQLIITYEEFTSTENKLHKTYKLINDNLDTILVLNKVL